MKQLTNSEVAQLIFWAETEGANNWGGWSNYPLSGCTYSSYEDCQVYIKFKEVHEYMNDRFLFLVSSRRYLKNENYSCLSWIESKYNMTGDTKLNELRNEAKEKRNAEIKEAAEWATEYRRKAAAGELTEGFKEQALTDVTNAINSASYNRFGSGGGLKVGDVVKSNGHIYLGSGASAVYSKDLCNLFLSIENAVKAEEFEYVITGKSGTGKTKYASMTEESKARLMELVNMDTLVERIVESKLYSAVNFKHYLEV